MSKQRSSFSKIVSRVLSVSSTGKPIPTLLKKVILGGAIEALPLSSIKIFFDINEDGKNDIKDLRALKWDDIAKIIVVVGIWYAMYHFKILSLIGF